MKVIADFDGRKVKTRGIETAMEGEGASAYETIAERSKNA